MTFDSIRVELYMTKFSFLTAFFSVCVSAAKTPMLTSTWSNIQQILCCFYVSWRQHEYINTLYRL